MSDGGKSLAGVIDKSEQVKDVVEECAEELASVNTVLNKEVGEQPSQQGVRDALDRTLEVERKVEQCAEDLELVNKALEGEVRERELLEQHLLHIEGKEQSARHAALHDTLTSLPNRALFEDRLAHGLAQATRTGSVFAVLFIDLDKFKQINDTHGHHAGDDVLREIASRLARMTREADTVSRRGGDEFVCLLSGIKDDRGAGVVAAKIVRTLSEPCHLNIDGYPVCLSIRPSIGISLFPQDGQTAAALLKSADVAMYRAKKSSEGIAFASPGDR